MWQDAVANQEAGSRRPTGVVKRMQCLCAQNGWTPKGYYSNYTNEKKSRMTYQEIEVSYISRVMILAQRLDLEAVY